MKRADGEQVTVTQWAVLDALAVEEGAGFALQVAQHQPLRAADDDAVQILDALDAETKERVSNFLAALPSKFEGGLRANDRIPVADLLSTFTGAWTLDQLGAIDRLNLTSIREYAESCEHGPGGFKGGLWDAVSDVEYTFYGLGVLALAALYDG